MHFVDQFIAGIGESFEVIINGRPGPGTGVGISFCEDVLGSCSCGANGVYRRPRIKHSSAAPDKKLISLPRYHPPTTRHPDQR